MICPTCSGSGKVDKKPRTPTQNNSLWLWCQNAADILNDAGYSVNHVMKQRVEMPWDKGKVMELIWRPIQKAVLGKESTRDLKKMGDIDAVYDVINRHFGEKLNIHVPWPSVESEEAQAKGYLPR